MLLFRQCYGHGTQELAMASSKCSHLGGPVKLGAYARYRFPLRMRAAVQSQPGCAIVSAHANPRPAAMTLTTALTQRLNCRHPIISAGMGGPARSELAAAVSEAGGFGLLGMVRETPDLIAREIADGGAAPPSRSASISFRSRPIPSCCARSLRSASTRRCRRCASSGTCSPTSSRRRRRAGCLVLHQVGSLEDALLARVGRRRRRHSAGRRGRRPCCAPPSLGVLLPQVRAGCASRSRLRAVSRTAAAWSPRLHWAPMACSAAPRSSPAPNPSPTTITSSA